MTRRWRASRIVSSRELWTLSTYQTSSGGGSSSSSSCKPAVTAARRGTPLPASGAAGGVEAALLLGRPPSGVCSSTSMAGSRGTRSLGIRRIGPLGLGRPRRFVGRVAHNEIASRLACKIPMKLNRGEPAGTLWFWDGSRRHREFRPSTRIRRCRQTGGPRSSAARRSRVCRP